MFFLFFLVVLAASSTLAAQRACNNSPKLCSASYDRITHLGAHDSPFLRDASTGFSSFGNQFFNTTVQLDAGVRLLTAQVHVASNPETKARELHLCHSSCVLFDIGPVHKWLWEIRAWLDAHPHDVVTLVLVNMDFVGAQELKAEYSKADLAHYGYVPPILDKAPPPSSEINLTWPTLGAMIDRGERLVSFVNALVPDKENAPYLLNEFDFIWENNYDTTNPSDFACTPDRPSNTTSIDEERKAGKLFLMNHLLYWQQAFGIKVPDTRKIANTNSWDGPGGVGTHMVQCESQVARQPSFVLVDFFNVGPAIDVVDVFNGVKNPVGRRKVTSDVIEGGAGMRMVVGDARTMRAPALVLIVATAMGVLVGSEM